MLPYNPLPSLNLKSADGEEKKSRKVQNDRDECLGKQGVSRTRFVPAFEYLPGSEDEKHIM